MDTRRDFLKKAILLSGATGLSAIMPPSIARALAINPAEGSTFYDAAHVVILMQENRSFDHCFGTLRGVRGYNDPRAIALPNGNPVWLQTNKAGETYAPFRFDIKDTKITWMGSVPHGRHDQVDANNKGKHDQWLDAKRSGNKKYADMPLTLGHYNREDLPFHYSMAEAFTVCDQNFSSAMTSTWPNRLFFWTGTIRGEDSGDVTAYIRNEIPYGEAHWKTFPETLQDHGISWKVYQNEITTGRGFDSREQQAWLSNFGCNPLEFLSQFNVRFHPRYYKGLQRRAETLSGEIDALEKMIGSASAKSDDLEKKKKELVVKRQVLEDTNKELEQWSSAQYDRLSQYQKDLFEKAFTTNINDADFMKLASMRYDAHGDKRELAVPQGDILYQFRKDVDSGNLPAVSWVVPSENFSDHPTAPWYGAWFTSEILDILTKNPEVWKKTIFIVTYDENDGYFDHIPPFVAPDPEDAGTGKCSSGINNTGVEFIRAAQEMDAGITRSRARTGPVGLGYRVPLIIASPWTRGGKVCSEVFDHTSTLQFLEDFLSRKLNKSIRQPTISSWRRAVCGNLTSAFSAFENKKKDEVSYLSKEPFIKSIHSAQYKREPSNFRKLTQDEIDQIRRDPAASPLMARQEPGTRQACPLPYQLYADGKLSADKKHIELTMVSKNEIFGIRSAGAPFKVYAPGKYLALAEGTSNQNAFESARAWDYAVKAGESLVDSWPLNAFENGRYHLRLYGPNGFYREFAGSSRDPLLVVTCEYERATSAKSKCTGNLEIKIHNTGHTAVNVVVEDQSYKNTPVTRKIAAGTAATIPYDLGKSHHWYDFAVRVNGDQSFSRRYAGKVETGEMGYSDPAMAGTV